ncbi:Gp19/Gp15/Gp42 family protein [Curtobacterium sp. MCBD17_021]|uniref:Gp19/Gp15/Gp42 family protein n=1 Tax=Curtobacterium sp. MCBD17_021 TaxID=2175665 RepID=UPI0015E88D2B|nr:Gp19/Gp15/Gp42 family protein [Curtobacterium sp. MCBD17_021]
MFWFDVDTDDIVKRWRPLEAAEAAVAEQIIEDAQDIYESAVEAAGIAAPAPDDERRERAYVRAVAYMVIRVFKNPDGILTETLDGYTYRRDSAVSTGMLQPTAEEIDQLRPVVRPRRGAFTIRPS